MCVYVCVCVYTNTHTHIRPTCVSGRNFQTAADASIISIDIVGRSFLYHMVRNIVGTLLLVP